MDAPFVKYGIYVLISAVLIGLLCYRSQRRKKLRLAAIEAKLRGKAESGAQVFSADFYCIMLTDGTTRSGFINQPKAKQD